MTLRVICDNRLEVDGCEESSLETGTALGVVASGHFSAPPDGETLCAMAFQGRRGLAMSQRSPSKAIVLQTAKLLILKL